MMTEKMPDRSGRPAEVGSLNRLDEQGFGDVVSIWRFAGAAFALGLGSQLSQVTLIRELLMVFHGNELSIGIALAGWLAWGGIGSFLAARLVRRTVFHLRWAGILAGALVFISPVTIVLLRVVRFFFRIGPGETLSFVDTAVAGGLLLAPGCLLWGAQFVLLAHIWEVRTAGRGAGGATGAYAWEAIGNLVGGMIFSLVLVHVLNPLACVVLASLLLAGALAVLVPANGRLRSGLLILTAAGALTFPFLPRADAWVHALHWNALMPERPLVAMQSSRYGRIAVTRHAGQHGFYQSGHLAFSTGAAGVDEQVWEEQEGSVLAHLSLSQHAEPRTALLIGGGLRGVLGEMLSHSMQSIVYIEIDPALIEAALPFLPATTRDALHDPRVRLVTADGRMTVKTLEDTYDLIVVDVPDPVTAALNRFYTREFFLEARRRLRPGGILVVGVTSTAGLRDQAAANRNATVYHTLRSVFKRVLAVGDRFLLFFATDGSDQLTSDPRLLAERYRERNISSATFSERHFFTLLQENRLRRLNWILRNHGRRPGAVYEPPESGPLFPPGLDVQEADETGLPPVKDRFFINTDFLPIGYYHSLVFWSRHTRGGKSAVLDRLLRVQFHWLAPAMLMFILVGLGLRLAGGCERIVDAAGWGVLVAVLSTGLSTMTVQLVLIFTFQSQYGFVYEMIGAITAVFMGGLALGAALWRRAPRRPWRLLTMLQLLISVWAVLTAVVLPALVAIDSPALMLAVFFGMTLLSGIWNGMNFPLALACRMACRARGPSTVGVVYGLELLGACLGAVLTGVVIIPVLGIVAGCLFAAVLNGTAFFVMLITNPVTNMNTGPRYEDRG